MSPVVRKGQLFCGSRTLWASTFLVVGLAAFFPFAGVRAQFSEPSEGPPGGSTAAPINVSDSPQTKDGKLTIDDDFVVSNYLYGGNFIYANEHLIVRLPAAGVARGIYWQDEVDRPAPPAAILPHIDLLDDKLYISAGDDPSKTEEIQLQGQVRISPTAGNPGELHVPSICLGGSSCQSTWPPGTSQWLDTAAPAPVAIFYPSPALAPSFGNVGIGTSNPNYRLVVKGKNDTTDYVLFQPGDDNGAAPGVPGLRVGIGSIDPAAISASLHVYKTERIASPDSYVFRIGGTANPGVNVSNWYGGYIEAPTVGAGGVITNKFALVTESGAGNVGIGTTTPTRTLEVNGDIAVSATGKYWRGVTPGIEIATCPANAGLANIEVKGGIVTAGTCQLFGVPSFPGSHELGRLTKWAEDSGVLVLNDSVLFEDSANGRIGLGTTAPGAKLTVTSLASQVGLTGDTIYAYANSTNAALSAQQAGSGFGLYSVGPKNFFSGNVGVGQSNPASKLTINDGVASVGSPDNTVGIYGNTADGSSVLYAQQDNPVAYAGYFSGQLAAKGSAATPGTGTISTQIGPPPDLSEVIGTAPVFGTEVQVGDTIAVGAVTKYVVSITDATHLRVHSAFSAALSGVNYTVQKPILTLIDYTGAPKFVWNSIQTPTGPVDRVGIGTLSPTGTLHIKSTQSNMIKLQDASVGATDDQLYAEFIDANTPSLRKAWIGLSSSVSSSPPGDPRRLDTFNITTENGANRILFTGGNVGIGTNTPSATLSVGVSTASTFTVAGDTGNTVIAGSASIPGSGTLTVNANTMLGNESSDTVTVRGPIQFRDPDNSNFASLQAGALTGDLTWTLPSLIGTSGQCLQMSATSGVLQWGACGGGPGADIQGDANEFAYFTDPDSIRSSTGFVWNEATGNVGIGTAVLTDLNVPLSVERTRDDSLTSIVVSNPSPVGNALAGVTLFGSNNGDDDFGQLLFQSASRTTSLRGAGTGGVSIDSGGPVAISTSAADRLHIDAAGNVGIGQVAPASLFTINDGAGVDQPGNPDDSVGIYANSPDFGSGLYVQQDNSNGFAAYFSGWVNADGALTTANVLGFTAPSGAPPAGVADYFAAPGSHAITIFTNSIERVRIDGAGNVGIGGSPSGYRLNVQGGNLNVSGSYYVNGVIGQSIGCPGDQLLRIRQVNGGLITQSGCTVIYDNGTSVGIGVAAPDAAAKLDIAGKVKIVDGSQGAGKVLTSDANGLATWQDPAGGLGDITAVITDPLSGIAITDSGGPQPKVNLDYAAAIAADPALAPNQALFGTNGVIFEGSAANTLETLLTAADPTVSDKTFLLPNIVGAIGTLISTGNLSQITATGIVTSGEWRGTRIAPLYGGTGIDTSGGSTSGVPVIDAGVWSVATSLAVAKGGTGATTAATARTNLGAAASGINSDISSILGLNQQVAIRIGSFSSGAGTGELQFVDLPGGGQFYVGLKAPDLVSANTTWSLPSADSAGCWQSDGAGVLSISTCPGGLGGGGLTNQIAKFTPDGATLGNSIISDNGTVATVAGDLTVAATETVTINGVGRTTWPNEAPIYTQTLFGATGDIPWRTTTASAQMVRQAYQPFAAGYGAMPSCPSGYTRKHGLYVEYVDNMTANPPPAPTGTPRVWLDSAVDDDPGDTMQWAMPLSWGGSPQIRKFTSPLFTDPGLGGNGVADHINVKTWIQTPLNGAYLELRKVEVRTFCQ